MDGARYVTTALPGPDYDLNAEAAWGGTFSDVAPYSSWSRAWDRSAAFGDSGTDARLYSFRHNVSPAPRRGAPAGFFRANLAFFDGHVELQDDLHAGNPRYWLPAGSRLQISSSMFTDVKELFGLSGISEMEIGS
jgi:prepilin-type processing-associated H-X9-DG protein